LLLNVSPAGTRLRPLKVGPWSPGVCGSVRDRLGVVDEGLEVVQSAAQVDERRVGQAHEPGQALQTLAERGALGGERPGGRGQVLDQRAQIRALGGRVGDEVAGLDQEVALLCPDP
jgi:hypothetical protein